MIMAETITEKSGWSPLRNGSIHFRQDQLFHVNHLSQTIRRETGKRFKFTTVDETKALIDFASMSTNPKIQNALDKVINSFSDELKTFFDV